MIAGGIHSRSSIATLLIAIATAYAAAVFGPATAITAVAVLMLGLARQRRFAIARALERPRLFAVLGVLYLGLFLLDAFVVGRGNPVPALGRLVVFLISAETLSGDGTRPHRPVLFALLLMVAAASQTTEIWFAIPLVAFALAAVVAQLRQALTVPGEAAAALRPFRPAVRLTLASVVSGLLLFFVIPRVGAGWGRPVVPGSDETSFESGLPASVRLGALGRVKIRRSVAFRARLQPDTIDPEALYWRARSYDRFTGDGWTQWDRTGDVELTLPADTPVPVPPEYASSEPDLVADVTFARAEPTVLPVPGRGLWVRLPRESSLISGTDGTLAPSSLFPMRRYQIAVALDAPALKVLRSAPVAASADEPLVDAREIDPAVAAWAFAAAPSTTSRYDVVAALVLDLGSRHYSLDTTRIDRLRPVASFLAGAPGHCEYFASALALGLRARGIPARVVGGFLGGERQTFGHDIVVRDSRAHLWTEVHFPGVGWVTFDATPPEGRGPAAGGFALLGALGDGAIRAWDTWVIGLDLGDQIDAVLGAGARIARIRSAIAAHPPTTLAGVAIAVGLVIALRMRRRVRLFARPGRALALPALYRRLLAEAERCGVRPGPAETAGQFAGRAGEALGDLDSVRFVSAQYERERFGERPPSAEEARAAEESS